MKKLVALLSVTFAIFFASVVPSFASDYLDSSKPKWSNPKSIPVVNNSSYYQSYVQDGYLNYWDNKQGIVNFYSSNDATNYNQVVVQDAYHPDATWDGNTQTYWSYGRITHADVYLNVSNIESYSSNLVYIRYRVIDHELGHTVGLGDLYSSSDNNDLMYGYTQPSPYYITLDDAYRLQALYN